MSVELERIQRMRINTESSFAVDGSGTLGNFVDVPFISGSATATRSKQMLDPETAKQHIDAYDTQIVGMDEPPAITFTMGLASTGTSAGNATPQVQSALGELLQVGMGQETLGTGTTVNDAGADADDFDATTVTSLVAGGAIGFLNDLGYLEARPIALKSSSNLLLRYAFSEAPDNSDVLYAFASYSLASNPTGSMQFLLEGVEPQDRWSILGAQMTACSLELPLGGLPRITQTWTGVRWLYGDDCATDLTGQSWAQAGYTNHQPTHAVGHFLYGAYNSPTYAASLGVTQVTAAPAITYSAEVTNPAASTGYAVALAGSHVQAQWRRTHTAPVCSGTFVLPFQDYTYFDARDSGALKQLLFQIGTTPGECVLLDFRTVQILNVERSGGQDVAMQTVSWACQLDQGTTGTSDLTDSAFRIHFG